MYDDNNSFEQFPGSKKEVSAENLQRAEMWNTAMNQDDVPEFAGEVFGQTDEITPTEEATPAEIEDPEKYENLSDAAAIINYGLNAAARQYGVETVVQKIKTFDVSASDDPIKDLFLLLGIDAPGQAKEVKLEEEAIKSEEADFYNNDPNAPTTRNTSKEGAIQAIYDMKELISEVEGADPRYDGLRASAKAAGKGYFEYAVGSSIDRSLTDLFKALAAEPKVEEPEQPEQPEETSEDSEETVV